MMVAYMCMQVYANSFCLCYVIINILLAARIEIPEKACDSVINSMNLQQEQENALQPEEVVKSSFCLLA